MADPAGVVIRPGGSGQESAATLARERLGGEPDPAFVGRPANRAQAAIRSIWSRCSTRSGGKGLAPTAEHAPHVLELGPAGSLTRRRDPPRHASRPMRRTYSVRPRSSVIGQSSRSPPRLPGLEPGAALKAASALVRADLLRHENPVEFTHPVVRTAVLEEMSSRRADARPSARRGDSARAGARFEQAATYLIRTIPASDPFVVTTLRRAAESSLAQGAPDASVAYLRRALDEPPAPAQRGDVLGELGIAEMTIDATSSADHLRQSLDELNEPTRRPEIVVAYANTLNLFGRHRRESADASPTNARTTRLAGLRPRRAAGALLIIACQFEPELYPIAAAPDP